jgi:hypothetical protein
MAMDVKQSKEFLLYAENAKSSSASNKWSRSRRWRYGVNEAGRLELMFGLAAGEIEESNRIRIVRREK